LGGPFSGCADGRGLGREFFMEIGEGLLEGCRGDTGGSEAFEGGAAFVDSLSHQGADTAEQRLGGRIGRDPAFRNLELQRGAEEAPAERVSWSSRAMRARLAAALFLAKESFAERFRRVGSSEILPNAFGPIAEGERFRVHVRSSILISSAAGSLE